MPSQTAFLDETVSTLLPCAPDSWPVTFDVQMCDVRRRFIVKPNVGRFRLAIARNGRVLLASDLPLAELTGKTTRVRMQTWHKAVLPDELPEAYGVLLVVRTVIDTECPYTAHLISGAAEPSNPAVEIGGGSLLVFRRTGV